MKPKPGYNKEHNFTSRSGAMEHIQINLENSLTKDQNLRVLDNLATVVNSEKLVLDDSDQIGNKYNHCNWGLCTNDPKVYDQPAMHTFPYDYINNDRVSPLFHIKCPMDKRDISEPNYGCFYHCRCFRGPKPSKEEALELIEIRRKQA